MKNGKVSQFEKKEAANLGGLRAFGGDAFSRATDRALECAFVVVRLSRLDASETGTC